MNEQNLYQILQVTEGASDEAITTAYRALCKRYHPDVYPDQVTATLRMQELNAAFEVLGDARQRRAYDRQFGLGRSRRRRVFRRRPHPPSEGTLSTPTPAVGSGRWAVAWTVLMVLGAAAGVSAFYYDAETEAADTESKVVKVETALSELIQAGWRNSSRPFLPAEVGPFDTVYLPAQDGTNDPALARPSRELVELANTLHWQNRTVAVEKINAALTDYNYRRILLDHPGATMTAPPDRSTQWRLWSPSTLTYRIGGPVLLAMILTYIGCRLTRWLLARVWLLLSAEAEAEHLHFKSGAAEAQGG